MRCTFTAAALLLLTGCVTGSNSYVPPGVTTPNNSRIDASEYNRQIQAQGLDYYCPHGKCDTLPRLITGYAPAYPAQMHAAGIIGQATIVFQINRDGTTGNFVIQSASAPEFAEAAIQALRLWKFSAATLRGNPVEMESRQQFPFELR
jgi:TonB family protein